MMCVLQSMLSCSTEVPTQSTSWADQMEDLDASKITPGKKVTSLTQSHKTASTLGGGGGLVNITCVHIRPRTPIPLCYSNILAGLELCIRKTKFD